MRMHVSFGDLEEDHRQKKSDLEEDGDAACMIAMASLVITFLAHLV